MLGRAGADEARRAGDRRPAVGRAVAARSRRAPGTVGRRRAAPPPGRRSPGAARGPLLSGDARAGSSPLSSCSPASTPARQCGSPPMSSAPPICPPLWPPRYWPPARATRSSSVSWCACWSTKERSPRKATAGSRALRWRQSRCRRRSMRCSPRASSGCAPRSAACSSAPRWSAASSRAAPSPSCCRATWCDLDARLEALRRSELIERDTGWFLGEPVLRFHHLLIRDAAYRRLLKGTRAELHARFADWVVARAGDAVDHDETIGWHLEQAHQLLRELGPLDAAGRVLGERAAQHLAAAGRRALARDDLPVAADLLGRAIARLDVDDSARADLALDWCEALLAAGDVGTAAKAIDELARFLPDSSDLATNNLTTNNVSSRLRAWHTCFAAQLTVLTAPAGVAKGGRRRRRCGAAARRARRCRGRGEGAFGARHGAGASRQGGSLRGGAGSGAGGGRGAPATAAAPTRCWPAPRSRRCGVRAR